MAIKKRKYKSYDKYLIHQAKKLDIGIRKKIKKFMPSFFSNSVRSFEKRVNKFKEEVLSGKILCLGARSGAEVVAFRNLGFPDTIGVDINPGRNNEYVIKGDFNKMEFEDNSFNTVYTNCIDHVWDLRKFSEEIKRVLFSNGRLILEVDHTKNKTKDDRIKVINKESKYESVIWEHIEDLEKALKDFKIVSKFDSACPTFLGIILDVKK